MFHGPVRSTCFSTPPSTKLSATRLYPKRKLRRSICIMLRYCSAPRCTNSALFRIILIMLCATLLRFRSDSVLIRIQIRASNSVWQYFAQYYSTKRIWIVRISSKYDTTRIGGKKKEKTKKGKQSKWYLLFGLLRIYRRVIRFWNSIFPVCKQWTLFSRNRGGWKIGRKTRILFPATGALATRTCWFNGTNAAYRGGPVPLT